MTDIKVEANEQEKVQNFKNLKVVDIKEINLSKHYGLMEATARGQLKNANPKIAKLY